MEMLPTCCKMNIPFLTAPKFNTSYPRPEHAEDWSKCVHEFHAVRSANDATSITTTHLHTKVGQGRLAPVNIRANTLNKVQQERMDHDTNTVT